MLDRVACLPGAPCLLARGTRLGGIAFYHVNGSYRAIPVKRVRKAEAEVRQTAKTWQRQVDVFFFFYAESVECKTTVLYTDKRPRTG